jgi:hypothetical protein
MLLIVLSLLLVSGSAFVPHGSSVSGCCNLYSPQIDYYLQDPVSPLQAKANGDDFKAEEIQEMEDMIMSLSREPSDDSRRKRLLSIFTEELAKPDGAPQHFTELFDQALVVVGDRVKLQAQATAQKLQEQSSDPQKADEAAPVADAPAKPAEAFPQQQQLWALVDMMVQSKTIVKRALGELGNKGTFQ